MSSSIATTDSCAPASPTVEQDSYSSAPASPTVEQAMVTTIDSDAPIRPEEENIEIDPDAPIAASEITEVDINVPTSFTGGTTTLDSNNPTSPAVENTTIQSDAPITEAAKKVHAEQRKKFMKSLPLYSAVLQGDLDTTMELLEGDPDIIKEIINGNLDTVLHIAVGTEKATSIVTKLMSLMPDDLILQKDFYGNTALHIAASTGNIAATKMLIAKLPGSLYVQNNNGALPVLKAAYSGHRDLLEYLVSETKHDVKPYAYDGQCGLRLLLEVIHAEFFDLAIKLVEKYPLLAVMRQDLTNSAALVTLATKDSAFYTGAKFNFWQWLIYTGVRLDTETEVEDVKIKTNDIENPRCGSTLALRGWSFTVHKWSSKTYRHLIQIVPYFKDIHDKKVKHQQAIQLLKCLCKHMVPSLDSDALAIASYAMWIAVDLNILEVVEIVVKAFPSSIFYQDRKKQMSIFQVAIVNRCEKVYNLIYQMSGHKHHLIDRNDSERNSLLHLAARLDSPYKLNLVSGAALQMQREIQWFKEVEKIVHPYAKTQKNKDGKKASVLFTEQHEKLKADGEKWMKDTATSCTIAAALIVTVVFAAAITVPGGNVGETGFPIFSGVGAFIIFAVSDVISFFTSSTSLLMFLSILTSRYAEEDFLYALPRRLCIGLVTLFVSILFMMIAFSATAYMVFSQHKTLVLVPVAALACLPVASFVLLQFPLLADVVSSTYGRGIFGKQSDRPFY